MSNEEQLQCPDCQSQDIYIDDIISVCTNCGNVLDDIPKSVFQPSSTTSTTTTSTAAANKNGGKITQTQQYHRKNIIKPLDQKRTTISILIGIKLISTLTKNLNISKSICEMAINLFRKVSNENEFKNCSTNVKQSLALCCLYIICNQENNHITLSELFKNSDSVFKHVGKILSRLKKKHPEIFEKNVKKIESLVPIYLFKHDFNDKERIIISDYAIGLIWMWQQACLIQGMNPITIIYVALFYAWKAIDQRRSTIKIKEFCEKFQIPFQNSLYLKVNYFFNILKKFAKICPLLIDSEELTKNTVSLRIDKILSMKRFIITQYNQINNDNDNDKLTTLIELSNKSHTKKKNDDDEDIDDEEIDSYIRTDDEVKEFLKLSNNN